MKRILVLVGILLLCGAAHAAVGAGENLLINGALGAEQVDFPEFWTPSPTKSVIYLRTGGPGGKKPAIALRGGAGMPGSVSARQQGLILAAGETYRLSAFIKTKSFKCHGGGLILHNSGWYSAAGIQDLPADSGWTFREKTFKLFPSKGREYGVALYATGMTGEIDFADVKLEAVSEGARKGSSSQLALLTAPRLVPFQPLLHRIPKNDPKLTFKVYGLPLDPQASYDCEVTAGSRMASQTCPVQEGRCTVNLAGLPLGDATLEAILRRHGGGKPLLKASFPITVIDLPAIDRRAVRPLNTLVSELLDQPLQKSPQPQSCSFVNPRDGWIFMALEMPNPATDLSVTIDGRQSVITTATERLEAFRELSMGEHRVTVSGAGEGRLRVRSIPEIFDYPPCADSAVKENGHYDWAFMKRHILTAVTTLNGGQLPGKAYDEARALGLKWLANFGVTSADETSGLRRRMEQTAGMTQPQYDGFTCDELFFGRVTIDRFTKALWGVNNPGNRLIDTWIVGKPTIPALHTDFMSACLNASRSRGRLLFEAYCHPQADEQAAAAYLDDMIGETMRRFSAFFPHAAEGTGIIFGNFNQIPIISLEHDPAVDFKYFLDMQVNLVANRQEFKNLATVGYWGTYYGDEELVRWSFKLMRHYAVEGRREMLSTHYGFTYKPGLLANGDFAEGLNGWSAAPAAAGTIRTRTLAGYGANAQGRWGAEGAGDTVCVMTRQAAAPNRISQTARGLTPGKTYSLQFVTGDLHDITGKNYHPRRYGIDAELAGADVLPDKSFVHIDRRQAAHKHDSGDVGKINLHRIVFRAKSPSMTVTFSDANAKAGEELVLNFVQLKPYLLE